MPSDASLVRPMALAFLSAALALSGCGGRVSRPVAATNPYDGRLSCTHLRAEKDVDIARARDLTGEQRNDVSNNIGLLLVSPLFLDLSGSEHTELRAFAVRGQVLDQMIARKCQGTAPG